MKFTLVFSAIFMIGCAGVKLGDRSNCTTKWEERKPCISEGDCSPDQVCMFRNGISVGKCSDVDCCDPWRHRDLKTGANWCENIKKQ